MIRSNRLGLTRTQAHSQGNRGYKHHAMLPINMARPTLLDTDYIATPIADEGVMLYSFAAPGDYTSFMENYGAEGLPSNG